MGTEKSSDWGTQKQSHPLFDAKKRLQIAQAFVSF
jgi:hypothetical protein